MSKVFWWTVSALTAFWSGVTEKFSCAWSISTLPYSRRMWLVDLVRVPLLLLFLLFIGPVLAMEVKWVCKVGDAGNLGGYIFKNGFL